MQKQIKSKKHLQLASSQGKQARNLAFVTSLMLKVAIFQRSISPEIFELHSNVVNNIAIQ